MGQLEKYGLYVLCLVIFLILGVTIWGNPAAASPGQRKEAVPIRVGAAGAQLGPDLQPVNRSVQDLSELSVGGAGDPLDTLLAPVQAPVRNNRKPAPAPVVNNPPVPGPAKLVGGEAIVLNNTQGQPGNGGKAKVQEAPATREYTVKPGDTLGGIALQQLGSIRQINRIKEANRGLKDTLQIGQVLILPASASSTSKQAVGATPTNSYRTYTISPGDTFADIAKAELGSESRVNELLALNPNVDPRRLRPGKTVKIPPK